jgi:hypothetical protein
VLLTSALGTGCQFPLEQFLAHHADIAM